LQEIFFAQGVFERKELLAVGGCGGEGGVVQREEEGVEVGHPAEVWRLNSRAHGYAVGKHDVDVGFAEDIGGVFFALKLADAGADLVEMSKAGGVEWRLLIEVVESLPCVAKRGKVGTHAGGIGIGIHGVDGEGVEVAVGGVVGRREKWVGVVVDGGDGGDVCSQGGVDGGVAGSRGSAADDCEDED
jgi:hypothetical protein